MHEARLLLTRKWAPCFSKCLGFQTAVSCMRPGCCSPGNGLNSNKCLGFRDSDCVRLGCCSPGSGRHTSAGPQSSCCPAPGRHSCSCCPEWPRPALCHTVYVAYMWCIHSVRHIYSSPYTSYVGCDGNHIHACNSQSDLHQTADMYTLLAIVYYLVDSYAGWEFTSSVFGTHQGS